MAKTRVKTKKSDENEISVSPTPTYLYHGVEQEYFGVKIKYSGLGGKWIRVE